MRPRILSTIALLLASMAPSSYAAAPLPTEGLDAYVERYAQEQGFSGVILITDNGRTAYNGAFGQAERAFGAPVQTDTRFAVASITKLFTSTLTLQLVDEGRLALDTPIGRYLDAFPAEVAQRITIRQLLNHTSGLGQLDRVTSYQDAFQNGVPAYQRPMSLDDALQLCCAGTLEREPGTAFSYNNADYLVLQKILERVSGKSFAQLLHEQILRPLSLENTGVLNYATVIPRLASTYFIRPDTGVLQREMPVYWENWGAAGAMYSSANDLAAYADALFAGRLLSRAARTELLRSGLDEYGLGLWSYSFRRHGRMYRVAKRPGSIMGANAVLYRLRDQNLNIILLANTNGADLDEFAQRIAEQWIDQSR